MPAAEQDQLMPLPGKALQDILRMPVIVTANLVDHLEEGLPGRDFVDGRREEGLRLAKKFVRAETRRMPAQPVVNALKRRRRQTRGDDGLLQVSPKRAGVEQGVIEVKNDVGHRPPRQF